MQAESENNKGSLEDCFQCVRLKISMFTFPLQDGLWYTVWRSPLERRQWSTLGEIMLYLPCTLAVVHRKGKHAVPTLYFDRSILKELCNWSSSFMNFSLCTKKTQDRVMEISNHSQCSLLSHESYCSHSTEMVEHWCQQLSKVTEVHKLQDTTVAWTPSLGLWHHSYSPGKSLFLCEWQERVQWSYRSVWSFSAEKLPSFLSRMTHSTAMHQQKRLQLTPF